VPTIYYKFPLAVLDVGEALQFRDPTNAEESLRTDTGAVVFIAGKRRITATAVGASEVEAVGEAIPFALGIVVQ
jgi:hypothetical protein